MYLHSQCFHVFACFSLRFCGVFFIYLRIRIFMEIMYALWNHTTKGPNSNVSIAKAHMFGPMSPVLGEKCAVHFGLSIRAFATGPRFLRNSTSPVS